MTNCLYIVHALSHSHYILLASAFLRNPVIDNCDKVAERQSIHTVSSRGNKLQHNRFAYFIFSTDSINNCCCCAVLLCLVRLCAGYPLFVLRRYQLLICFSLCEKMDAWCKSVWKVSIARVSQSIH